VDDVTEYRAFDNKGVIVSLEDLTGTDSAVAWGIRAAVQGAVLVERRDGDEWVCFEEYRGNHLGAKGTAG
jgi:hypothetical protein